MFSFLIKWVRQLTCMHSYELISIMAMPQWIGNEQRHEHIERCKICGKEKIVQLYYRD